LLGLGTKAGKVGSETKAGKVGSGTKAGKVGSRTKARKIGSGINHSWTHNTEVLVGLATGSAPLTYGSGSGSVRSLPFSSVTFKTPTKNHSFPSYPVFLLILKENLHNYSKKSHKEATKQYEKKVFLTIFAQ
jgi:hypothetical protein